MSIERHSAGLSILDTQIRRDPEGRYNLNDCHRAAGGEKKNGPAYWQEQAQDLIDHLQQEITGIPVIVAKQGVGTFVAKELVYAYAMWISPAFHLAVIRAFDAMVSGKPDPIKLLNDPAAMRGLLLSYTEKVLALEAANASLSVDADALHRIAVAEGSLAITDAAKALQIRPKSLFDYLDRNHWTYRRAGAGHRCGYQARIASGDLVHKVTTVLLPDGTERITEQVRVTPQGLAKLAKLLPGAAMEAA